MTVDRSKISRNNKNRGRKFERDVADYLGWTRVPYSGAIVEWGGADVVDGFYKKGGFWAAECKTVILHDGKPAHIDIKHKWIEQLMGGETGGRHGILIVRRIRDPKKNVGKKALPAYVIFPDDTFNWFLEQVQKHNKIQWLVDTYVVELTKARGYNFRIPEHALRDLEAVDAVEVLVGPEQNSWHVTTLYKFAEIVKQYDIMEHDDEPRTARSLSEES